MLNDLTSKHAFHYINLNDFTSQVTILLWSLINQYSCGFALQWKYEKTVNKIENKRNILIRRQFTLFVHLWKTGIVQMKQIYNLKSYVLNKHYRLNIIETNNVIVSWRVIDFRIYPYSVLINFTLCVVLLYLHYDVTYKVTTVNIHYLICIYNNVHIVCVILFQYIYIDISETVICKGNLLLTKRNNFIILRNFSIM